MAGSKKDIRFNGRKIFTRNGGVRGLLTGTTRRCQLEGCSGIRVRAVWPDGSWTWPCTKGLHWDVAKQVYRII